MNAGRQNRKEFAYKGILLLMGMALFAVRLSDRFYLLTNKPFVHVSAKHGAHKIFFCAKPGLSREYCFSPDKRYHSENGFTLFTPMSGQRNWLVLSDRKFHLVNEMAVWLCFPAISLRGPPEA